MSSTVLSLLSKSPALPLLVNQPTKNLSSTHLFPQCHATSAPCNNKESKQVDGSLLLRLVSRPPCRHSSFILNLISGDRLNVRPVIRRALPLSTLVRLVRVQSSQKGLCGRLHQHGRPNLTPPTSSTHINTRIRLGLRKPQRFRTLAMWFVR